MKAVDIGQKAQQEASAETTTPNSKSKRLGTNVEAAARLQLEPSTLRSWRRCGIGLVYAKLEMATKATVRP